MTLCRATTKKIDLQTHERLVFFVKKPSPGRLRVTGRFHPRHPTSPDERVVGYQQEFNGVTSRNQIYKVSAHFEPDPRIPNFNPSDLSFEVQCSDSALPGLVIYCVNYPCYHYNLRQLPPPVFRLNEGDFKQERSSPPCQNRLDDNKPTLVSFELTL